MVVHALNYNVGLRETPAKVTEVKGARITVPLPQGWTAATVKAYDPDSEGSVDVKFESKDGQLTFDLPTVRIYKVIGILSK